MTKRREDEDEVGASAASTPKAAPAASTGWGAATEVYKFVCTGCNQEKRSSKMLDGKCEACWPATSG